MKRIRGFRLRTKLVKAFKWVVHGRKKRPSCRRLSYQNSAIKVMSKLCNWGRSLKHGAKLLCSSNSNSGYGRVGQDPIDAKPVGVPKGHMAVYVGEKEDETHRFFVPVVYFNHPLFGDLLREAEKVYGFNHSGGIQIPCRISEFERVRTRVAGGSGSGSGGGDSCPGWRS